MANIAGDWNKSMPSGSSSVSDGDDLLRQHQTSLESTLAQAHRFGSAETLAGYHKPGTARVYTGLSSANSADNLPADVEENRLFAELDTSRLFLTGLSAQTCLGPGVGAWNCKDTSQSIVFGDNMFVYDSLYADVAPRDGETWITLSGATVTVPSGCSGFFRVTADMYKPGGFNQNLDTTHYLQLKVLRNGVPVNGMNVTATKSLTTVERITQEGIIAAKSGDSLSVRISSTTNDTYTGVVGFFMGHKVG